MHLKNILLIANLLISVNCYAFTVNDNPTLITDFTDTSLPALNGSIAEQNRRLQILEGSTADSVWASFNNHNHNGINTVKILATNLNLAGITSGQYLYNNGGVVSGATLPTGSGNYSFSGNLTTQQSITTGVQAVGSFTEDFDTGSNFSGNTFTAPVDGKYLFTVAMGVKSAGVTSFYLTTGGNDYYIAGCVTSGTTETFAGGGIILNLTASSTVVLNVKCSGNGTIETESHFTGTKLY